MQSVLSQATSAMRAGASAVNDLVADLNYRAGVHYILSGSFKSTALYLLAFDPVLRTLNVTSTFDGFGPHQYLAFNENRSRVYATTWATPPHLSAWAVERSSSDASVHEAPTLRHLGNADITAVSSYISVTERAIYSAGGPTAEVHDFSTEGGFGSKLQQLAFVPDNDLADTDKTRKALRIGSHGFDITKDGKAFIPHLGHNSIYMYEIDTLGTEGELHLLSENKSPREGDGPRHVWPHPNGKILYSVTEHTNFIDVYEIQSSSLKHVQSGSIVPSDKDPHQYRGNTLRLSRDGEFIFGSTRGSGVNGYVAAFAINPSTGKMISTEAVALYEMPTTGGIAGAIEPAFWKGSEGIAGQDYMVLVDEEEGFVRILGWSKGTRQFKDIASRTLPAGVSASHAIWLS